MRIERIEDLAGLDRLESAWNALYAADAHAHVFMSWPWMREWLRITPYKWTVLVARDASGEVAGLVPLALAGPRQWGVGLVQTLYMGGKPISDYSGFLAFEKHAGAALAALGRYAAKRLSWDRFRLQHVIDPRLAAFLDGLSAAATRVRDDDVISCPYLTLPGDWDEYLEGSLSYNNRYKLRRGIRQVERLPGFRTTVSTAGSVDDDIAKVLGMWRARWGTLQPHDLENYQRMLRSMFDAGVLWLRMLWEGDEPVAGLVGFIDPVTREFSYFFSGFNPRHGRLSPGKVIVGWCIRDAIEQRLATFDFLLGDEEYKVDFFSASERPARSVTLERTDIPSRVRQRLARWLPAPRKPAAQGQHLG